MNTNVKSVCGVLTAKSDFKIYTVWMLIYLGVTIVMQKPIIVMKCQTIPPPPIQYPVFYSSSALQPA